MSWTSDKRACKALYFSLQRANQFDLLVEFDHAGTLKMKDLLFFNMHSTIDLRRQEAIILAFRLDNEFTTIYKAKYEGNESSASSIAKMVEIMMKENKNVEDLSDKVDSCYKFKDEKNR